MFIKFCVGLVVCILAHLSSGTVGMLSADNEKDGCVISWIVSTIGFGVCLTVLLYQNGVIK